MSKLIVFGRELNWDDEHEITLEGYGMNIEISVKELKRPDYTIKAEVETRHNCTEFHHRFDKMRRVTDKIYIDSDEDNSAFESDIHSTGGTKRVGDINWIKVTVAEEKHKEY
jgi:hypothetical protein